MSGCKTCPETHLQALYLGRSLYQEAEEDCGLVPFHQNVHTGGTRDPHMAPEGAWPGRGPWAVSVGLVELSLVNTDSLARGRAQSNTSKTL